MSAGGTYIIKLGLQGDVAGADAVTRALKGSTAAADDFINTIKAGVGIDIGGRIVNQLAQIPGVIEQAIARGVQFNSTIEGTVTAVAAVLEKFQGMSKPDAIIAAGAAVEELKRQAVDAPGTISDIAQAWTASAGAASAANIPINEQIDLMVKLSQAVSRLNLPQQQLVQETRALLTGNITLDAQLAKTLGVTNEMIRAAKEQGNLYGFLVGKIGALGEASDTFEVRMSNFNDVLDQTLGKITEPIFDELRDSILTLTKAIQDPKIVAGLKDMGFEIAGLVKNGASLTKWAIDHAPALALVAKGVGMLTVALAAMKIAQIVVGLTAWTLGLGRSTAALAAETAALRTHTAAQVADNTARAAGTRLAGARAALNAPAVGLLAAGVTIERSVAASGDLAAGLAVGGKSSAGDMARAQAMRDTNAERISALSRQIQTVTTQEAASDLKNEIIKGIQEAVKGQREAGFFEEGRTAQNQALADFGGQLAKLAEVLNGKMPGLLNADEAAAAAQAKTEAARLDAIRESVADYEAKRGATLQDRDRERTAADSLGYARELIARGDVEAGRQRLDQDEAYYRDQYDRAQGTDREGKTEEELKAIDEATDRFEKFLEAISEARKELPDAIAEAEKKAKDERVKGMQEQIQLVEATGKKRLADLEALNLSEKENADRRREIEDDIAAQRLALENKIGQLQEETDTARQARLVNYEAERIARENQVRQKQAQEAESLATGRYDAGDGRINATTGVSAKYGIKGAQYDSFGNLTGGTRGGAPLTTAELGSINSAEGMGGSTLDRFKNSQPGMPGYQPLVTPATLPPAAATPPAAPGAPGAPAAPGQESGGEGPTAEADKVKEAIGEGVKAVQEVLAEFLEGAGEITKTVTEQGGKIVAEQKATGGEITGKMGEFSTALEQLRQTVANLRS